MIPRYIKSVLKRLLGRVDTSSEIQILHERPAAALHTGWQERDIAQRQHDAFRAVVADMHAGRVREDFTALAAAMTAVMRDVANETPSVIEVGAGSGWNSEVLDHLLRKTIRYTGLDYSETMMRIGRTTYPQVPFVVGDAAQLPLATQCCDVLISGTVLMHVLNYEDAIRESRRVARHWCIFHTIPVLKARETTVLQKRAYGVPVVEIVFNEAHLLRMFESATLRCVKKFESIPHRYLDAVVGESVSARTYLCECV